MKTLCFCTVLLLSMSISYAQDTKSEPKPNTSPKMVAPTRTPVTTKRTAPETPPPAPAASKTAYYLTSAKVSIVTGNDNKELPSEFRIFLDRQIGHFPIKYDNGSLGYESGLYNYMRAQREPQELKVNSTVEFTLDCAVQLPNAYGDGWRYGCLNLDIIQDAGISLTIQYIPNFPLDAWKIEKMTLTLEFKDLAGNPHPSMSKVVIPFLNASKILRRGNEQDQFLTVKTDRFLLPIN